MYKKKQIIKKDKVNKIDKVDIIDDVDRTIAIAIQLTHIFNLSVFC